MTARMPYARSRRGLVVALITGALSFGLIGPASAEPVGSSCSATSWSLTCDTGSITCTGGRTAIIRTLSWGWTYMSMTGRSAISKYSDPVNGQVQYFVTGRTYGTWAVYADKVNRDQTYAYCSF